MSKKKKKNKWLSKRPVDLRKLITRLITTLVKVFGLLVDPYTR